MIGLIRLLTTRGLVKVTVCPLCASVVLRAGERQHRALHAVTLSRNDGQDST